MAEWSFFSTYGGPREGGRGKKGSNNGHRQGKDEWTGRGKKKLQQL